MIHLANDQGRPLCNVQPERAWGRTFWSVSRNPERVDCPDCIALINAPTVAVASEAPLTCLAGDDGTPVCGRMGEVVDGVRRVRVATSRNAVNCTICIPPWARLRRRSNGTFAPAEPDPIAADPPLTREDPPAVEDPADGPPPVLDDEPGSPTEA